MGAAAARHRRQAEQDEMRELSELNRQRAEATVAYLYRLGLGGASNFPPHM